MPSIPTKHQPQLRQHPKAMMRANHLFINRRSTSSSLSFSENNNSNNNNQVHANAYATLVPSTTLNGTLANTNNGTTTSSSSSADPDNSYMTLGSIVGICIAMLFGMLLIWYAILRYNQHRINRRAREESNIATSTTTPGTNIRHPEMSQSRRMSLNNRSTMMMNAEHFRLPDSGSRRLPSEEGGDGYWGYNYSASLTTTNSSNSIYRPGSFSSDGSDPLLPPSYADRGANGSRTVLRPPTAAVLTLFDATDPFSQDVARDELDQIRLEGGSSSPTILNPVPPPPYAP